MKNRICLTGIRPSLTPEAYRARVESIASLQSNHRCFVLIADCQCLADGSLEGAGLEKAVESTVSFLAAGGIDFDRCVCFLQSQVPQLAELSRLLEGCVTESPVGSDLACNSLRPTGAVTEVADMLMFQPDVILGTQSDRADFEVASTVLRILGEDVCGAATFVQIDEPERTGDVGEITEAVPVSNVLSFGGTAARIEAQKTLEAMRERLGLNYAMFR